MLLSAELPREGEDAGAPRRQKARDRPAEATTAPRLARPAQDTAAEPGLDTMTADQRAPKSPADASGRPAPAPQRPRERAADRAALEEAPAGQCCGFSPFDLLDAESA